MDASPSVVASSAVTDGVDAVSCCLVSSLADALLSSSAVVSEDTSASLLLFTFDTSCVLVSSVTCVASSDCDSFCVSCVSDWRGSFALCSLFSCCCEICSDGDAVSAKADMGATAGETSDSPMKVAMTVWRGFNTIWCILSDKDTTNGFGGACNMTNRTLDTMRENIEELVLGAAVVEGIMCDIDYARNSIRRKHVNGICQHDIDVISGLMDAYKAMFDVADKPMSFDIAAKYNWCVEHKFDVMAGTLRTESVYISGCDYVPPMPSVDAFDDIISAVYDAYEFSDDRAVFALLHCAKRQFFCDGNKRAAQVVANHILAHDDAGCMVIVPTDTASAFLDDLLDFYDGRMTLDDAMWVFEERYVRGI